MPTEMMDILRLTKTGNLIEATAAIQRALRGGLGQADDATHPVALDATQTSAGVWTTVQDQPVRQRLCCRSHSTGWLIASVRHGHQPAAPVALPDGASSSNAYSKMLLALGLTNFTSQPGMQLPQKTFLSL